jgi:hypothetical protein
MHKKKTLFTYLLSVLLFSSCLQKFDNYGVTGTIVTNADNTTVTVLVAENNAVSYQKNGGYIKTTYSTIYWLKQYETATGKLIQKKKVFTPDESNRLSIACYGRYGNNIWMHTKGLTAFDINTLEEVTNEKKIATVNGVSKTIFPLDDRLITPDIEKGIISFITDNGEAYRLTLNDLIITKKTGEQDTDPKKKQMNRLSPEDDYGARCDTLNNKLFAFAKNESAAKELSPEHGDISETAYRMKLFKADYRIHQLGMHNSFTYDNMQEATTATYLNPRFAVDTYTGKVIHLANPGGYIVIHQDVLGDKSKALITRMDANGKVIWEKQTGVSTKIESCTLQGKYLIIATNKDCMLSSFIGKDALCIIDTNNGNIIQPSLSE